MSHTQNQLLSQRNVDATINEICEKVSKEYGQKCSYEKDHNLNLRRAWSRVIYIAPYKHLFVISQIRDMLFISSSL